MLDDIERLHSELTKQSEVMFHLRRRITQLQGELRRERQAKAKLLKEKKEKQHYRNGQKRGRTRNG